MEKKQRNRCDSAQQVETIIVHKLEAKEELSRKRTRKIEQEETVTLERQRMRRRVKEQRHKEHG